MGKIQRVSPSCAGCASRLPPGSSINSESHTSPRTFANDVSVSANTTSEKYTRWGEGNMHLCTALRGWGAQREREQHQHRVRPYIRLPAARASAYHAQHTRSNAKKKRTE